MISIPLRQQRNALVSKRSVRGWALFGLVLFPDNLAAQGLPVETASHIPVALWFIGAGILGVVLAYGIMRNRKRTAAEKRMTESATKTLYAEERRDSSRSTRD